MRFRQWLEAWAARTPQWKHFRDYMRDPDFSVGETWHIFQRWNFNGGPGIDELGLTEDDPGFTGKYPSEDFDYDFIHKADEFLKRNPKWKERYLQLLIGEAPEEAPSMAYMSHLKELPPQTWLVHFTNDAWGINAHGFKYGTPEVDRLGLTTYFGNSTKPGGYNFAFEAGDADARLAANSGKYGREAVMFMSPAVLVHHMSDEEDQAVFDGKRIDPDHLVVITRDGAEWVVNGSPKDPFRHEDFERVQKWVVDNWRQYQRIIMGGDR
jgi:hypothetical protein